MQTANIVVKLGDDGYSHVPKYGVTPSEVAVLQAIHGPASVTEIEPLDDEAMNEFDKPRSNREEKTRLAEIYGRSADGRQGAPEVEALFPGANARMLESFDDLDLDPEFFKAEKRMETKPSKSKGGRPKKSDAKKADDDQDEDEKNDKSDNVLE